MGGRVVGARRRVRLLKFALGVTLVTLVMMVIMVILVTLVISVMLVTYRPSNQQC